MGCVGFFCCCLVWVFVDSLCLFEVGFLEVFFQGISISSSDTVSPLVVSAEGQRWQEQL